jgi:hypothetical protein
MDATAVTTQLEDLLKAHAAFMAKEPPYSTVEQTELVVRMEAAIERLAPRSSRYVQEAERIRLYEQHNLRPRGVRLAGVLKALKEDVNAGWLKTVEELALVFYEVFGLATLCSGGRVLTCENAACEGHVQASGAHQADPSNPPAIARAPRPMPG